MNDRPVTAASIKMVVKITSREDSVLCGILDSAYFEQPHSFTGEVEMLKMMETTFDALGFPDRNFLPRTFGKAKTRMRQHETDIEMLLARHKEGSGTASGSPADGADAANASAAAIATFEVTVAFRLNAEWQGRVHWVDKDISKDFRSFIELVKFIDEKSAN